MSDGKGRRASRESADPGDSAAVAAETAVAQAPEAPDAVATALPAVAPQPRTAGAGAATPKSSADPIAAATDAACAAFGEAQLALSRSLRESSAEWAEMARAGLAAGTDAAAALLAARTLAEVADIQAMLARRALDAAITGTARLSDIGIRTADEAARPILSSLTRMSLPFAVG